jgi:heat shock protein HslJ
MNQSRYNRAAGRSIPLAGVILGALVLTACEDEITGPSDLGGTWELVSLRVTGGPETVPPDPSRFTVEFEADGQLSARADCNGCGGTYELGDDSLVVEDLACTLIACQANGLDTQFITLLDGSSEVDLDGDELEISSSRGTLRFRR